MVSTPDDQNLKFPSIKDMERSPSKPTLQVSEESFTTACSSFSSSLSATSTVDVRGVTEPPPTASIRALRKSTSIDSFVRHRHPVREEEKQKGKMKSNESSDPSSRGSGLTLSTAPSSMSLSGYFRSKVGQRRRTSHSTTDDTSTQEDSDFDRAFFKGRKRVRSRLLSFKSTKAASDMESSNRQMPLSPPKTPFPVQPGVPDIPPNPVESSRTRSQSVGASAGSSSRAAISRFAKRLSVGSSNVTPPAQEVVIAVIGTPNCGKSTFIYKSLKRYELSNPEKVNFEMYFKGTSKPMSYISRKAHLFSSQDASVIALSAFEFNVQDWELGNESKLISAWPSGFPRVDGVFICYDCSRPSSFTHVLQLLNGFKAINTPTIVLACKCDLEQRVDKTEMYRIIDPSTRVVEISHSTDEGKSRMRSAMGHFIKHIVAEKERTRMKNMAGQTSPQKAFIPQPLKGLPHDAPALPPLPTESAMRRVNSISTQLKRTPSAPSSPTRARSMNDILTESQNSPIISKSPSNDTDHIRSKSTVDAVLIAIPAKPERNAGNASHEAEISPPPPPPSPSASAIGLTRHESDSGNSRNRGKGNMSSPWVTFEELLDKLFFLAISGDDPAFIAHFLLTYRRFATPRSVLLGMQKRMIALSQPNGDGVLAAFAQMRICGILEQWIRDYAGDFTVPGTSGALSAFIRQLLSHPHTLCYGSDFLPFVELLPTLTDLDSTWAMKSEDFVAESDESESYEDEPGSEPEPESPASGASYPEPQVNEVPRTRRSITRERRSSLPLSAMSLIKGPYSSHRFDHMDSPSKELLLRLQKTAISLDRFDSEVIAKEITRREAELFLKIERRHWLRHTMIAGKKDPSVDPIARFNNHYNFINDWAVSLILCHDKPKARARQIEKFAEIAVKLRALNNYSGLRAIVTAISRATFPGDEPMELFRMKTELHKKFLSSDILLRTTGSHQSYRMALRNTKGPCIPSLEVHTSDLRRANEGNPDENSEDQSKINWAKYNMIGRFVLATTQLQDRCRLPGSYQFPENKLLSRLLDIPLMDEELQQSRISQPTDEDLRINSAHPSGNPASHSKDMSTNRRKWHW